MVIAPHIESRPGVCGGRPVIVGTRMRVTDILEMLADGTDISTIIEDFPFLTEEHIRAALAYAAQTTARPMVAVG